MNYLSIPYRAKVVKATEARLNRLYEVAKLGLKGDSLAIAAGMTPQELRALQELDEAVSAAIQQGKADAEAELAGVLMKAARNGDTKAALAVLERVHGWEPKSDAKVGFGEGGIVINIGAVQPRSDLSSHGVTIENGSV